VTNEKSWLMAFSIRCQVAKQDKIKSGEGISAYYGASHPIKLFSLFQILPHIVDELELQP